MWKVTVKGLLAHKLRLALTALAIVLGVTFISGTFVLTDTLHNTFTTLFGHVYQNVDFVVRGKAAFNDSSGTADRKPIPESIEASVLRIPGVAYADGSVTGPAQFIAPDGKAITTGGAPTIGFSFDPNSRLSILTVVGGRAPASPTEVAMDVGTADKYHFKVGDHVRVLLAGPTRTFTISGLVKFGSADNLAGATLAAFDLPTAQRLFNEVGHFDSIDVLAQPGTDKATLQRAIAKDLPPGVEVVSGQAVANEQTNSINQALGFFSTALLVFAFISLFVGGFTIFNTFSILVGQRTRELALLRIVGASRRQVFRSVLLEAGLLGLVASLVGLGLGVLSAVGLESLLKGFGVTLPTGPLVFETRTVIVALVVGIGVTVVSAISPARRAVRIPPVAAMVDHQGDRGGVVPSSDRGRDGHRRPRYRRAGHRPEEAGHPAGRGGGGGHLHRHRDAGPHRGPPDGQRPRPAVGPIARDVGKAGARELDAQPAADGPDLLGAHGGAGPRLHHRRVRSLAVQIGHQQRRPGRQRRLHHHQLRLGPRRVQQFGGRHHLPYPRGDRGVDGLLRAVRIQGVGVGSHRGVHRSPGPRRSSSGWIRGPVPPLSSAATCSSTPPRRPATTSRSVRWCR